MESKLSMEDYPHIVKDLHSTFRSGRTKPFQWRDQQLRALLSLLEENTVQLSAALYDDLHKNSGEAFLMEIGMCRNEVVYALNNLQDWMRPEKVSTELVNKFDTVFYQHEPYGVTLLIGAWNYPVQLIIMPLIGAIAGGNCCLLKPSEVSQSTTSLLSSLIPQYLDNECVKVVNGGATETTALLLEQFDIIFYTGSARVARLVMSAAAERLTPVVLELGGKSPVFVDNGVDLDVVAKRLCWGKWANCGQTCIAPDYVMCTADVQKPLVEKLRHAVEEFFTSDPQKSDSYGRIVNRRHFHRIQELMKGCNVAFGGQTSEDDNYIAPTVLTDCKWSDPVMQEEVFGPLLPVVAVKDHHEAIQLIADREKPLAMYIFTNDPGVVKTMMSDTSSGAVVINDVIVHCAVTTLPFGGVGKSGIGSYHGKFSFEAFTHKRACVKKSLGLEFLNTLRYPPYTEKKSRWLNWMLQRKPRRSFLAGLLPFVVLGAAASVLMKTISF